MAAFPASFPGVLAVAADDVHDASEAIYLAPGRDIPTTLPGRRWGLVGGSSYAAAQVAGLVALLIDLAPEQSTQQIRETLSTSERSATSPRHRAIVDACAAVARTVGACACGCRIARGASADSRSIDAPRVARGRQRSCSARARAALPRSFQAR